MKLLIEIDLDKIHAAEPDDLDAAEGIVASLIQRAAGKIVKDGVPEMDGLAFALRHDGETLGKMSRVELQADLREIIVDMIRECERSGIVDDNPDWYVRASEAVGHDWRYPEDADE